MISEVVNSLFLTYLASEYLVADDHHPRNNNRYRWSQVLTKRTIPLAVVVLCVNIFDHLAASQLEFIHRLFQGFLHLPRILFAATAYMLALYVDICHFHRFPLSVKEFFKRVGVAFCIILPAYPILAVLISFVFLFVINIWEALHLPMEWLNAPIYYGTLYGPFAWVYVYVKRQVCEQATSLPA